MSVSQMTPDEIYSNFMSRIIKTNMLYAMLTDESSIELTNTIYFKYYFDISTAIEAAIRGITFEESKKNSYIKYLAEPASKTKSFFIYYEELKALIEYNNIYNKVNENDFIKQYINKILALKQGASTKKFKNLADFKENYEKVRNTRNLLAHGLAPTSVEYNKDTLESFLFVLYVLLNYYRKHYSI